MNITFVSVGKIKNQELASLFRSYLDRLDHYASVKSIDVKDSTLQKESKLLLEKSQGTHRIVLSEEGKQYTSVEFARFISNLAKDISFIIGCPEGLSPEVKKNADFLLSLSIMTLPHELCRVLLAEQVYRAFTIINKDKYHR